MPSGGIRVDENTLGFAKEADEFLAIASSGCSTRDIPVFWRELSCDPERVQRYWIAIILPGNQSPVRNGSNVPVCLLIQANSVCEVFVVTRLCFVVSSYA